MNSDMTSMSEAQETAEKQLKSAIIPLAEKTFLYDGVEVNIIRLIKDMGLSQAQIEIICNMEVNSTFTIDTDTSSSIVKRIK